MDASDDDQRLPENAASEDMPDASQAFVVEPLPEAALRDSGSDPAPGDPGDRMGRLAERIAALEAEFDRILSHLRQLESQLHRPQADEEAAQQGPVLAYQALVAEARAKAAEETDDDRESIRLCAEKLAFWTNRAKSLKLKLREAAGAIDEALADSSNIHANLPEEVREPLANNQEGLNIIGRMLQRLVDQDDRLEDLVKEIEIADTLETPDEDAFMDLLEGEQDGKSAKRKINRRLRTMRRANHARVSEAANLADKRQKAWRDFVGIQALPIADGIRDGTGHTSSLIDELAKQHRESESQLRDWFDTHATLRNTMATMLNDLGVFRMDLEPGMVIDYERHEPCSVEADPGMENEQIKEISRDGYEYLAYDGSRKTLRVARVVVVKNSD